MKKLSNFKKKFENNPIIYLFGLFLSIALAIPAGLESYNLVQKTYYNSIGWKESEEMLINKLSPNQSIDFFNSVLGTPELVDSGEKFIDNIYRRKGYWLQAVHDRDGKVLLMSITVCSPNFYPKINNTPLYEPIVIGKDTMYSIASENFTPHYFISGATAPTYLIDEIPSSNPTKYQNLYFGINDACNFDPKNILADSYYYDSFTPLKVVDTKSPKVEYLRENMPVNTIAITAPFTKIEDLRSDFFIGVDRNELRVLPAYTDEFLQTKF